MSVAVPQVIGLFSEDDAPGVEPISVTGSCVYNVHVGMYICVVNRVKIDAMNDIFDGMI